MLRKPSAPASLRILTLGMACLALGCTSSPFESADLEEEEDRPSAVENLRGDPADLAQDGFAQAVEPRDFVFPADHGPHPDFQTEWWYLTGRVETAEGRVFGFQWTLFRHALVSQAPARSSSWGVRDAYMAHFAVSDVENGRQYSFERQSRGSGGLAGAQATPFRAWLEDWELRSEAESNAAVADGTLDDTGGEDPSDALFFPLRLKSADGNTDGGGTAVDLRITTRKPKVLQGERGLSRKNGLPGGASYYYSYTRLAVEGQVEVDGESFDVKGEAWLDREWSTSVLAPDQAGWDWFSLQLDSGEDLMLYHLRLEDGSADAFSAGVWVEADGGYTYLSRDTFEIEILDRWKSPRTGSVYPSDWILTLPDRDLRLAVTPLFADQELAVGFQYWEGAVAVEGTREGRPITGGGYVELVGY